jgi:hypothetical protein
MKRGKAKTGAVRRVVVAAAAGLMVLPALAQDRGAGGLQASLSVNNRLEYTTNAGLDSPAEDPTTRASTRLNFTLSDATPISQFSFSAASGVYFIDGPGTDGTGFDDPELELAYRREGANARLGFDLYWRETDISFARPLEDFIVDGELELPEDIEDLFGAGTRTSYGGNFNFALGTQAPFGVEVNGRIRAVDYSAVTNPSLVDTFRTRLNATAILRFSETDTGRVGLRYQSFDAENVTDRRSETRGGFVGYDRALSPTLGLQTEIGYSIFEATESGLTTTTQGFTGALGLDYDLPNGTATADLTAENARSGTRITFEAGRSLDLPLGQLRVSLGATRADGSDWATIGELVWRRDLPTGQIVTRLSRSVATTGDDSEALATQAGLIYTHDINPVSSLRFDLRYYVVDYSDADPTVRRTRVSAAYSRALTEDWNMNFGLSYQDRVQDGGAAADSKSVFVSLSRRFDWLP